MLTTPMGQLMHLTVWQPCWLLQDKRQWADFSAPRRIIVRTGTSVRARARSDGETTDHGRACPWPDATTRLRRSLLGNHSSSAPPGGLERR
jgi:hypothetical protein